MATDEPSKDFLLWFDALQALAKKDDSQWLVSNSPDTHLTAYQKGQSPAEELAELDELAQWRGCGCGGS